MRGSWRWDLLWFLVCAAASTTWCVSAAAELGPTFDEPIYLKRGLEAWRTGSHAGLIKLGTMPLPADVQTLPLYLWEVWQNQEIDVEGDLLAALYWMRLGNLVFWCLLLFYGLLLGRMLAGPWGGRLAVALLACEPSLLGHASLATTDISIAACMLAFCYHFRDGRERSWPWRVALPALIFGVAILAKASAIVFGPICMAAIELERFWRQGSLAWPAIGIKLSQSATLLPLSPRYSGGERQGEGGPEPLNPLTPAPLPRSTGGEGSTVLPGITCATRAFAEYWHRLRSTRRDFLLIGLGGLACTFILCGCDFRPQPSFVAWARALPDGPGGRTVVWLAEHLCLFSNAGEGIVRQIKHNLHGQGTYLLGNDNPRSVWYYFPVLLTIKLTLPILMALVVVAAVRIQALGNWALWTAFALLAYSPFFRVQIGIRMVLLLVALGLIGLAAAVVESIRTSGSWRRWGLSCATAACAMWAILIGAAAWPHGLSYVNELWGGPAHGYEVVSDANYDWGQGLPELLNWQRGHGEVVDLWYFGTDPRGFKEPFLPVPLHALKINGPEDVVANLQHRYLAAATTVIYGSSMGDGHQAAAEFLRSCKPIAKTSTFLIFERRELEQACLPGISPVATRTP